MFDAIQNELQYRFGTQGANEGTLLLKFEFFTFVGVVGK